MPHGKERGSMNAARSRKDRIGRYTRQAFVDQMRVGRATAERARIGSASIAILRLDEYQRHRGLYPTWTHQTELTSIMQPAPLIADALHTRAVAPVEHRRQAFDTGGCRVARFLRSELVKRD